MKGMESTVEAIRDALAERISERAKATKRISLLDGEIRRLRTAERVLSESIAAGKAPRAESSVVAVEAVMRELGQATQSEVAKLIGKPKNTVRAGLEQLVQRGVVHATGEFERRSPRFALVEQAG